MRISAIVCCLAGSVLPLNGADRLAIKVTPMVAMAPAFVRVEATIERDADNRSFAIIAQSNDFYRSSEIQLDGASGPRVRRFEFPHLTAGVYEVTGILVGQHGRRATETRLVRVGMPLDTR
jgi:hypothetical protein